MQYPRRVKGVERVWKRGGLLGAEKAITLWVKLTTSSDRRCLEQVMSKRVLGVGRLSKR